VVRARKFTVVNEDRKAVAELGTPNGVSYISFYDTNYKSQAQITVTEGEGPRILSFDKEQHQRALLEVTDGPHLVLHSSDTQIRALLTADDDTATFWLKDKKGFATIFGNVVAEAGRIEKNSGQPLVTDMVKKTPGVSIQLRDPVNGTIWKAPRLTSKDSGGGPMVGPSLALL
jgi:hypothetical protein